MKSEKKEARPKKKRRGRFGLKKGRRTAGRMLNVLGSFKIRRFVLDLDTGYPVANAICYPLFSRMRAPGRELTVNWIGRRELDLVVVNRPIRMLIAWLK